MDLQVLDLMPDAVLVCDREGSIRYANRTAQALLGYEPAELVGLPIAVLVPTRFRGAHSTHVPSYFAAARVRPMGLGLELTALKKDGHESSRTPTSRSSPGRRSRASARRSSGRAPS